MDQSPCPPGVRHRIGVRGAGDPLARLFLAIGAILGVVLVLAGNGATGWTLVVFSTASMLGAAVVLAGTGRRYLNSAFVQGSLPLITLLFAFIGSTFSAA